MIPLDELARIAQLEAEIAARDAAEQQRINTADRLRLQAKRDLRDSRCPHCGRAAPKPPPKAVREANAARQKAWRDAQKRKKIEERDRREAPMLAAANERVRQMMNDAGMTMEMLPPVPVEQPASPPMGSILTREQRKKFNARCKALREQGQQPPPTGP